MDTKNILTDLRTELNRLDQAIAALESLDGTVTATTPTAKAAPKQAKRRGLTHAGRRRLSAMMKARWAARHKAAAKPAKQTRGRRTVSAASRKKMAEAQRKRWAAVKKAAAKKPAKKVTAGKTLAKKAKQGSSGAGMMDLLKSVFQ
jgi:hypothetical protein